MDSRYTRSLLSYSLLYISPRPRPLRLRLRPRAVSEKYHPFLRDSVSPSQGPVQHLQTFFSANPAMCQAQSYSSPIALSQPPTSSCLPIAPMIANTTSFGRYIQMDSASAIDFVEAAPVVVRSQHLSYYVTLGLVLLGVWLFQSVQANKSTRVKNVPFYKASIIKWYFDAETLVRDSYLKV